jgi:hypothetical protein
MSHPDPYGVGHRGVIGSNGAVAAQAEVLGKLSAQNIALREALHLFMDATGEPPPPACSCHISPPCHDCVDHSALRKAFAAARLALGD